MPSAKLPIQCRISLDFKLLNFSTAGCRPDGKTGDSIMDRRMALSALAAGAMVTNFPNGVNVAHASPPGGQADPVNTDNDKEKSKAPAKEYSAQTDRDFVMAAGMTEAEADCWAKIAEAAGAFFKLPELHPLDNQEVVTAVHVIQNKLLSRPTYRRYLKLAKAARNGADGNARPETPPRKP